MSRQQILGSAITTSAVLVLSLVAAGAMWHRESTQGSGASLLATDIILLVAYGWAGILVGKQRSPRTIAATVIGAQIGLIVGAVAIANHLAEAFVPARSFLVIIGPVLLTLALLGTAGAAAWERSGSLTLAIVAGVCCAIVATLITLCFAISFNLLLRREWTGNCARLSPLVA